MKKHAIAVMMIAVFSESVYAESTLFIPDVSPDSVTTSLSVGVLNGKSRELVYDTDTGRKLSQLDWKNKKCRHVAGGFIMGTLFVHDAGRPRLDVFGVGIGSYG